jgi:antitoxin (DNA-binding transcriptional repressor) of toxin-antitoxin stability system
MVQVTLDEITHDPQTYLDLVEAGQTLVILKAGKPVAEVKPLVSSAETLRPFGLCTGEFIVPDDFDAPLPKAGVASKLAG